jgi:aryl-alcohol dehydrogenase-like predicted oxidoreductase
MRRATLGPLGAVSRLTLGGGIGLIWGPSSRDEATATIHAALDAGIDLLDTAPLYNACEAIIGETFAGRLPQGVRITTKCGLGTPPPGEAGARLAESLDASLRTMRLERIDVYFLHSNICADDYVYAVRPDRQDGYATRWSIYENEVIPAMERLREAGKIGCFGITGIGEPDAVLRAIAHERPPGVVQAIANLLDSAGALRRFAGSERPREIIAAAKARGIGVMGIRAVQAGALTAAIDREVSPNNPDTKDYERAAPFRALCGAWGEDPALVAHRYALGIAGVDTVVLGVKNRAELAQCLEAEAMGPLDDEKLAKIEELGLRGN